MNPGHRNLSLNRILQSKTMLMGFVISLAVCTGSLNTKAGVGEKEILDPEITPSRFFAPAACKEMGADNEFIVEMFPPQNEHEMGIARLRMRTETEMCPYRRPQYGGPR